MKSGMGELERGIILLHDIESWYNVTNFRQIEESALGRNKFNFSTEESTFGTNCSSRHKLMNAKV